MNYPWMVCCNGVAKAGFLSESDAREYASLMRSVNRAAGYKDKYEVVEDEEALERIAEAVVENLFANP